MAGRKPTIVSAEETTRGSSKRRTWIIVIAPTLPAKCKPKRTRRWVEAAMEEVSKRFHVVPNGDYAIVGAKQVDGHMRTTVKLFAFPEG